MNLPRTELMKRAQLAIDQFPNSKVFFKFTCASCGARCALSEPNILYEDGICCECGAVTEIVEGGFSLYITASSSEPCQPSSRLSPRPAFEDGQNDEVL